MDFLLEEETEYWLTFLLSIPIDFGAAVIKGADVLLMLQQIPSLFKF